MIILLLLFRFILKSLLCRRYTEPSPSTGTPPRVGHELPGAGESAVRDHLSPDGAGIGSRVPTSLQVAPRQHVHGLQESPQCRSRSKSIRVGI